MSKVLRLNGQPINWLNPVWGTDPTVKVMWSKKTIYGKPVKGSLRTICHFDRLNNLSIKVFDREIEIIQSPFNSDIEASAGTHDFDAVADVYIPGIGWWRQQRFFRANGFGCWYRHPPLFGNHIHGFTLPPWVGKSRGDDFAQNGFKVGVWVPGQLEDYYKEAFGLADQHTPGSDNSWFPDNKRATIFNLRDYIENQRRIARRRAS
jgi:hypothetical protein